MPHHQDSNTAHSSEIHVLIMWWWSFLNRKSLKYGYNNMIHLRQRIEIRDVSSVKKSQPFSSFASHSFLLFFLPFLLDSIEIWINVKIFENVIYERVQHESKKDQQEQHNSNDERKMETHLLKQDIHSWILPFIPYLAIVQPTSIDSIWFILYPQWEIHDVVLFPG